MQWSALQTIKSFVIPSPVEEAHFQPTASSPHSLAFVMQWSALQTIKRFVIPRPIEEPYSSNHFFSTNSMKSQGMELGYGLGPSQAQDDTCGLELTQ